ncbi:uncharacterized protein LOC114541887 [Dendronephthya gigantea]|uniref:uncharacterized protein LOC114541887 n=2 Tax=Dendronephthya gigantea TaxID=151771 RepID=UPI00106D70D5|nr:uncharacterized protein LOC114541887 [Dendronephthya gigantea]
MLDPSISGTVTGKRIRKSAVSRHRQVAESGKSGGLSKHELARQMSHSTSTAEGHYAMRDAVKGRAKVSNFLRYVATTTPEKGVEKHPGENDPKFIEQSPEKSPEDSHSSPEKSPEKVEGRSPEKKKRLMQQQWRPVKRAKISPKKPLRSVRMQLACKS